jgi:hypothetical protein
MQQPSVRSWELSPDQVIFAGSRQILKSRLSGRLLKLKRRSGELRQSFTPE